jgi:hypothetical protein
MRKAPAAFLTLVIAAAGFAIAGEFIHSATVPVAANVADQVEEGFKRAADRVRPTLPKRVDDAPNPGRAISGRKQTSLVTGSKGGVVCALA